LADSLILKITTLEFSRYTVTGDLDVISCWLDDVALTHELFGQSVLNQFMLDLIWDGI
jgi:hypothetical protein